MEPQSLFTLSPRIYFIVHVFFFILSLVDTKKPSAERRNLLKKVQGNFKALDELSQNSAAKRTDHPNS